MAINGQYKAKIVAKNMLSIKENVEQHVTA